MAIPEALLLLSFISGPYTIGYSLYIFRFASVIFLVLVLGLLSRVLCVLVLVLHPTIPNYIHCYHYLEFWEILSFNPFKLLSFHGFFLFLGHLSKGLGFCFFKILCHKVSPYISLLLFPLKWKGLSVV